MKKTTFSKGNACSGISLLFIAFIVFSNFGIAQIKTPPLSPKSTLGQTVGLTDLSIEYSRPSMRNRNIFGELVPYNKVWRTGANQNTKFTSSTAITIGGKKIEKGTYAIYTIPNKDSWEIIFYADANNWGNPQKWDDSKVVHKVTVPVVKVPFKIETFTITFDDITTSSASIGLLWEDVMVNVSFGVPTDEITLKNIDRVLNGPSTNDYFQAASFYFDNDKDINKALTWMKKATSGDDVKFWQLRKLSLIHAKMGNYKEALKVAKKSLKGAQEAKNNDYIKMNEDSIKDWSKK